MILLVRTEWCTPDLGACGASAINPSLPSRVARQTASVPSFRSSATIAADCHGQSVTPARPTPASRAVPPASAAIDADSNFFRWDPVARATHRSGTPRCPTGAIGGRLGSVLELNTVHSRISARTKRAASATDRGSNFGPRWIVGDPPRIADELPTGRTRARSAPYNDLASHRTRRLE